MGYLEENATEETQSVCLVSMVVDASRHGIPPQISLIIPS